jgi:hypothetical protein
MQGEMSLADLPTILITPPLIVISTAGRDLIMSRVSLLASTLLVATRMPSRFHPEFAQDFHLERPEGRVV